MLLPTAAPHVVSAMEFVEEFGAICQVMYLMMIADRRIKNVEREVLRGALDVLSANRIRTAHMDAMLDASARDVARRGVDACFERAIAALKDDELKAETTLVLAAAVAFADGVVTPEEASLLRRLAQTLEVEDERVSGLIERVVGGAPE